MVSTSQPPPSPSQPSSSSSSRRAHRSPLYIAFATTALLLGLFLYTARTFPSLPWSGERQGHHSTLIDLFSSSHLSQVQGGESMAQVGKRIVGYYVNWGIYGRKFFPWDIPHPDLTHINYAFANVNAEQGTVFLSDTWADVEIHWEGDDWNEPGKNLYGCFKQLLLLKQRNRGLKVMLSIGGWTYSPSFARIVDPGWRREFVSSATKLVEDVGLDGLDIDYEYPKTPSEAAAYVDLLRELRQALDGLADHKQRPRGQYQISVAAPGGAESIAALKIREMDPFLDFWNVMSYDFAGSWDSVTGHLAPLFDPTQGQRSVDAAVNMYLHAGVAPHKLTMGMPLYGRAFANTDGPGNPFSPADKGSWEAGTWDYKDLPQPGAQVTEDPRFGLSYSYDPAQRLFISYDTPAVAAHKARYILERGLGGAMFWDLSGDVRTNGSTPNPASLLQAVRGTLGKLEQRPEPVALNELHYPGSAYDNVRKWSQ